MSLPRSPVLSRLAALAALAAASVLPGCESEPELVPAEEPVTVVAESHLIRISPRGLLPSPDCKIAGREHVPVAFLNTSPERLVSVRLSARGMGLSCKATHGLKTDGASTFTPLPLSPGEVASLCIHQGETFKYEILGAHEPLSGTITSAKASGGGSSGSGKEGR